MPLPSATVQVWAGDDGWVSTVTLYMAPLGTGVANVNGPSAATAKLSPRLLCKTNPLPMRPVTLPPTAYVCVAQTTMTVVTLPVATVPEPWLTEQICAGPVGCVLTVTAKVPPLCIGVENANEPFALTVRSLPPLFCRVRPVPARALTVPPTVYELIAQLTTTPVTSLVPIVPDAPESWQVWAGPVGWALIDTVKVAPLAT